jgi:hypothetical protein
MKPVCVAPRWVLYLRKVARMSLRRVLQIRFPVLAAVLLSACCLSAFKLEKDPITGLTQTQARKAPEGDEADKVKEVPAMPGFKMKSFDGFMTDSSIEERVKKEELVQTSHLIPEDAESRMEELRKLQVKSFDESKTGSSLKVLGVFMIVLVLSTVAAVSWKQVQSLSHDLEPENEDPGGGKNEIGQK